MDSEELARKLNEFGRALDERVGWIPVDRRPPPEDEEVRTKVDDDLGIRNVQTLVKRGRLWWLPDGSMYACYEPTHWKPQ